jgi:flagellar hook-associated protein 1 FlgK
MSGLMTSLVNNSRALSLQSQALQVTGKNISNVNNTQYARQRVSLGSEQAAGSQFFQTASIEQLRDSILDSSVASEMSNGGSLEAQSRWLSQLETVWGDQLSGDSGFASDLDAFFNSWSDLSIDPTDASLRSIVMGRSEFLVDRFNQVDSSLTSLTSSIDAQIETEVSSANIYLSQIGDLNQQIVRMETRGLDASDLKDARQAALESLSELMNISVSNSATSGAVDISVWDNPGALVSLVDASGVLSTLSSASGVISATNTTTGVVSTLALTGGKIAGDLEIRGNVIPSIRADLDALATQMVTSVNAIYTATTGTTVIDDFFTGSSASTIAINSVWTASNLRTTDSAYAGSNEIALDIAALSQESFTGTSGLQGTFSEQLVSSITTLGELVADNNQRLENQSLVESMLLEQRSAVSGVDLNEEVTTMIRQQRAFQASARVVNTIDEMLDLVVNRLGS